MPPGKVPRLMSPGDFPAITSVISLTWSLATNPGKHDRIASANWRAVGLTACWSLLSGATPSSGGAVGDGLAGMAGRAVGGGLACAVGRVDSAAVVGLARGARLTATFIIPCTMSLLAGF